MSKEETLLKIIDKGFTELAVTQLRRAVWEMITEAYSAGRKDAEQKGKKPKAGRKTSKNKLLKCDTCRGSGSDTNGDRCSVCGGSGVISPDYLEHYADRGD